LSCVMHMHLSHEARRDEFWASKFTVSIPDSTRASMMTC
jgi:hypothetical protein